MSTRARARAIMNGVQLVFVALSLLRPTASAFVDGFSAKPLLLPRTCLACTSDPLVHGHMHGPVASARARARATTTTTKIRRHALLHATTSSQNVQCTDDHGTGSSRMLGGMGVPSTPGWKSGRLNRLTRWADNQTPNRDVICEYQADGFWLWRRWRGTVLKSTWPSVVVAMCIGLALDLVARRTLTAESWAWYSVPTSTDRLIQVLGGLRKAWEYHLTLTTFILTFFLSQSLAYWQKVYNTVRMIQGRINDYCMLMTMGSQRDPPLPKASKQQKQSKQQQQSSSSSDPRTSSKNSYTPQARALLHTCTRLIRMSHTLFWACSATASNGLNDSRRFNLAAANCPLPLDDDEAIGPVLLSPFGLKALVNTGQLTKQEVQGLVDSGLPPSQYAYVLLVWVGLYTMEGLKEGWISGGGPGSSSGGGFGLENNLLSQLTSLRASMFDVDDFRAGRMPLAYVQLVQVLVDALVVVTPFALYSELGRLSIPLVGLLALFFRGLLALSKSLLDPFGVEGFKDQNIRVDVLVSELNFGAAKRWIQAGGILPVIDDGSSE